MLCGASLWSLATHRKSGDFLARPERFERPTPRFVVWCSIQLSYGRFPGRSGVALDGTAPSAKALSSGSAFRAQVGAEAHAPPS